MEKKKVVLGMSGGVDSSVAAYLLKEEGYEVLGVTMEMWNPDGGESESVRDAKKIAEELGIQHYVMNFQKEFKEAVIDNFIEEYRCGRTPNPCLVCNRKVKWEALMERGKELGAEYIATGHYAKILKLSNGRYAVANSETAVKDQTYVLYGLTQEQLAHTLMPVGNYEKEKIRKIAADLGLSVADKPDSQDICFIPDNDYAGFISRNSNVVFTPGNFVSTQGEILGQHKGIVHYTVGQRKGLNLSMGYPVFVTEIRPETNEVVIGKAEEVFSSVVYAENVNFMGYETIERGKKLIGKIRYAHKGAACSVEVIGTNKICCHFEEAQRAVTPGQAIVLYDENFVALGGTIVPMVK